MFRLLLTFALTAPFTSNGQIDYRPIPEQDATWIQCEFLYSAFSGHEHATITSVVYTETDTIINGLSYTKFGEHGFADWVDGFGNPQNYNSGSNNLSYPNGYFRQDIPQKQVFLWNPNTQTDELLYDFGNLVIGQPYPETVNNLNYPNLKVMATDSILLMDGQYYKRWVLGTDASDSSYVSIIEGVGGSNGFNTPIYPVFEQTSHLLCHKYDVQGIYENWTTGIIPPRFSEECSKTLEASSINVSAVTEIYPNPTERMLSIETGKQMENIAVYSLSGQLLFSMPADSNTIDLHVGHLNNGTYLLKVKQTDGTIVTNRIQVIH